MCSIDLEPCDVWAESRKKARKPHRCAACGSIIRPGRTYLRHFSIFDGDITTEKACGACQRARDEFAAAHGQSFTPSCLGDMLRECIDYAPAGDPETKRWRILFARFRSRRKASTAKGIHEAHHSHQG